MSGISGQPCRFAGVDDGRFGIKVVTDAGEKFYVPSRVAIGAQVISIGDGSDDNMYDTQEGNTYTVAEGLPPIDTRFGDYDFSDINRVLVNHALIRSGMGGQPVKIVTGMPVAAYFIGNGPNADLIERKKSNLTSRGVTNRNPSVKCPAITDASVTSEAIAAFFDLLLGMDGSINERIQRMVESGPIAIADIGGETTDCAVIINGGKGVDAGRSGTARIGTLSLNAALEAKLKHHFKLDSLTAAKVEQAAMTGKLNLYREDKDVADIVNQEKRNLAAQIIAEIKRKLRDAADLEGVFFVGGGALLLRDQLIDLYPHAEMVEDPQFANARGMLKIAKFIKG